MCYEFSYYQVKFIVHKFRKHSINLESDNMHINTLIIKLDYNTGIM